MRIDELKAQLLAKYQTTPKKIECVKVLRTPRTKQRVHVNTENANNPKKMSKPKPKPKPKPRQIAKPPKFCSMCNMRIGAGNKKGLCKECKENEMILTRIARMKTLSVDKECQSDGCNNKYSGRSTSHFCMECRKARKSEVDRLRARRHYKRVEQPKFRCCSICNAEFTDSRSQWCPEHRRQKKLERAKNYYKANKSICEHRLPNRVSYWNATSFDATRLSLSLGLSRSFFTSLLTNSLQKDLKAYLFKLDPSDPERAYKLYEAERESVLSERAMLVKQLLSKGYIPKKIASSTVKAELYKSTDSFSIVIRRIKKDEDFFRTFKDFDKSKKVNRVLKELLKESYANR